MHLFPSPSAGLWHRSIQASRHFVVRHFSLLLVLLLAVAAVCVFVRRSGALSLVGPIPFAATGSPAEAGGKGNPAGTFGNHAVTLPAGATFEVNSTADTNNGSCSAAPNGCTLRDAINAANANPGADTITFSSTVFAAPGPYTISLSTALPDITTDMTIQGPGAKVLTVERNSTAAKFRIFTIASGTVAISGLTITKGLTADGAGGPNGGPAVSGGGISNNGTLTLTGVAVSANRTGKGGFGSITGGAGGGGGGIENGPSATLTINSSTISANQTGNGGDVDTAGIIGGPGGPGGGITNAGTLIVTNSTISGNQTGLGGTGGLPAPRGQGGGIRNSGTLTISNSTITANTAIDGGGVIRAAGSITLKSSIVAGNSPTDISGSVASDGYNLVGRSDGSSGYVATDQTGTVLLPLNPQLNPLADNGGPTMTHSLLCSSPAIDKGKAFGLTTDQRGTTRTLDLADASYPNASGGDGTDIGAYETQSAVGCVSVTPVEVNSKADTDDGSCDALGTGLGNQDCTLHEAIRAVNIDPNFQNITFNSTVFGAAGSHTISLLTALPDITTNMGIQGPGSRFLIVERNSGAASRFRIFTIAAGTNVQILGMTITKGFTAAGDNGSSGDHGGGIYNSGSLTLSGVAISNNQTGKGGDGVGINGGDGGFGGGILNGTLATLTIMNSTINGNQTGNGGNTSAGGGNGSGGHGGGITNRGTLTVTNSTISGNQTGADGTGGSSFTPGGRGGGILNLQTLTISNSTITANTGTTGGGIRSALGPVTIKSTIVAGNSALFAPDIQDDVDSEGFNLIGNTGGATVHETQNAGTNIYNKDPQLNPLADNGRTMTHSLLCTSPAIDKGKAFGLTFDQRGITRTLDLADASYPNASGGDGTDIGAYETQSAVGCLSVTPLEVNSTADTHDGSCDALGTGSGNQNCTLREAISVANVDPNAQTITFNSTVFAAPGPHTISLLTALPNITTNTTIQGPGANLLTVQRSTAGGTPDFTVFIIVSSTVNISGLTISNGSASFGGGVINAGTLTLTNCTVSGNTAGGQGGGGVSNGPTGTLTLTNCTVSGNTTVGAGGGVASSGTLTVINSTVSGNTSLFPGPNNGGGGLVTAGSVTLSGSAVIGNTGGGIVSAAGALTLTNSTVSGNTATRNGGGIFANSGTLALVNSTVTNNRSDSDNSGAELGGGIFRAAGTVTLKNTIVAGNFRGTGTTRDDIGAAVDGASSFNLIGDGTNMTGISNNTNGNQVGSAGSPINAMLGALGNNGGPTPTHLLLLGSPAINAGSNGNLPADTLDLNNNGNTAEPLPIDQRGVGFPRIVQTTVDIGAVEVNYAISATAGTPQSAATNTAFGTALKATVTESGNPQNNVSVTFTAPASGASGTFQGTGTNIATATTGSNGVATAPVFTANLSGGSFSVIASIGAGLPTATFNLTNNAPPTVNAAGGLSRQQGSPVTNSQIATVTDDGGSGGVAVTIASANPSNGVTISGIGNTGGNITANIIADCSATNASFTLQASDGVSTSTATLNIAVTANSAPTLSYANPPALAFNGSTTVTPATATDNGPNTVYSVQSVVPSLTTAPTVNASGVVSITNAQPGGTHTITIRATDNCSVITDATFTLDVRPPPTLGNYPNTTVALSAGTTVTPDTAPTGATSINVSTDTNFKGTFAANPATGIVRVTDAHPAGPYTVTVTAFNSVGVTTTQTFQLTVQQGTACSGVFTFANAADASSGSDPQSVAIGDFNNDGKQDLAIAHPDLGATTVSIRLGDGLGGFSGSTEITGGSQPQSVAIGDFNGDGKQDLAIANLTSSNVSIRLGDGLGGFSGSTNIGVGTNPTFIAIGDFNNDGKQDFAAVNGASSNVSIRLGDGLGGFTSPATPQITAGSILTSVAIGDFNQDGKPDLAISNFGSDNVSIRLGDGSGGFTSPATPQVSVGDGPRAIVIGDFNNDGHQDFATPNSNSNNVSIRLGDGLGGFSAASDVSAGSSPRSGALGDFNNDGKQDLAIVNNGANNVSIRLGDGLGGFSGSTQINVGSQPYAIAVGDFNGDGKQDFANTNRDPSASSVSIRLGGCNAATTTTVTSSTNPSDFGQSVTFTATVTSGAGTPTGSVQFKDNGGNLGAPIALNASGQAQLTTSSLTAGTHTITADYSGDVNFLTSTGTLSGGQVVKSQPSLSINDVAITEGNAGTKSMNFTVTLSAASSLTVTANYATANGTATAPTDYAAIASTLLTFNPGDTSKTVSVTINGDIGFEPDETLFVNLSNPANATISDNQGQGTIQNDDAQGGFIGFSNVSYSVNENTGFVTVTVTRSNDVSQAATVDYATDDTGSSTNCAALNTGLASQRCDYTSMFGKFQFAPNETQKTLDIPINLDAYTEGPETFTVKLLNPTGGAVLAAPSTAIVTINDSASPTPNANDDTTTFVRQQYRDFLNREADPAGLAFWVNNIDKCNDPAQRAPGQTLAACIEVQRITTSAAFFLSIEFRQTGGLVRDFYVAALDRPLTNNMPEYVEFMRDAQAIQKGVVVGQGNWQQVLNDNRTAFMNEFVTRAEFIALYPTTDTPTQYVDKLYQHAKVTGTQQERLDAIAYFDGAATAADTGARARALLQVTQSGAFQARELNRGFVQMQYFGYLRRNPNDPPDGNFNGFNFWVSKLNQFNGDFLQAEMVKAFLSSSEYRSRFGH